MNFVTKGGENRAEKLSTIRTYLCVVTPTGAEQYLNTKYAPVQQVSTLRDERATRRLITTEYETNRRFTLKIFTSRTTLGKPKETYGLFIHVDPNAEEINITGIEGFGGFMGRGVVDLKKSGITVKELRSIFNYEVLSGPIRENKSGLSSNRRVII